MAIKCNDAFKCGTSRLARIFDLAGPAVNHPYCHVGVASLALHARWRTVAVQAEMDRILARPTYMEPAGLLDHTGRKRRPNRKDPAHLSLHCHGTSASMRSQAGITDMAIEVVRQLDWPSQRSAPAY